MGKINREELFKILDEQYEHCKRNIIGQIELNMDKLQNYKGDVIGIRTEINMGKSMEGMLFYEIIEDYHDKQKLLSSVPKGDQPYSPEAIVKESVPKTDLSSILELSEKIRDIDRVELDEPGYRTQSVTAPKQHKKKYLIKLNNKYTPSELAEIGKIINENQIFVYNQDVIEQIITLDVE